jgi:serine/threonine protein kinase
VKVTGLTGTQYNLDSNLLSDGGEGEIYRVLGRGDKKVAKIYKSGVPTSELEDKLTLMVNHPPSNTVSQQVAWPLDVVYDSGNRFCGFIMPALSINAELGDIYKYPSQLNVSMHQKIKIAENICVVISEVHKAGYIFGDFNPRNIGLDMKSGIVSFLDTDTYHVLDQSRSKTYRCNVCAPGYAAPELLEACSNHVSANPNDKNNVYAKTPLPTFTRDTDNFALAIHIFKLLMNGYTPYGGIIESASASQASPGTGDAAVRRDNYCFKPGYKPQAAAIPTLESLPKEVAVLFTRAFINGKNDPRQRPFAVEWHSALVQYENTLVTCANNNLHQYDKKNKTCPLCEADQEYGFVMSAPKITQSTYTSPPPVQAPLGVPTVTSSGSFVTAPTYSRASSKTKSRSYILERGVGYPLITAVFAAVVFMFFFSGLSLLSNLQMTWVIDQRMPFTGGPGQSFHLPQYAARALTSAGEPGFFQIAGGLISSIYLPFVVLLAGAVLSAIICWLCKIKQRKIIVMAYGFSIMALLLYLFFNPNNFTGVNHIYRDLGFFNRMFSIFTPLAIGTLVFTIIYSISGMERDNLPKYFIGISAGYMLITLISAGIQNNIIGLQTRMNFDGAVQTVRMTGYHFPWLRFIIVGAVIAAIAMLPSLLCSYIASKISDGISAPSYRSKSWSFPKISFSGGFSIGHAFVGLIVGGLIGILPALIISAWPMFSMSEIELEMFARTFSLSSFVIAPSFSIPVIVCAVVGCFWNGLESTRDSFSVPYGFIGFVCGGIEGILPGLTIVIIPTIFGSIEDSTVMIILVVCVSIGAIAGFLWNGNESARYSFNIPMSLVGIIGGGVAGFVAGLIIGLVGAFVTLFILMPIVSAFPIIGILVGAVIGFFKLGRR